jgi:hypothetical protein
MMRRHSLGRIAILAALGCGPFHRSGAPDPVVIFSNQSADQADVYAVGSSGSPVRIGTVFAGRQDTLRIRLGSVGASNMVNIIARIFASSRAPQSGPVAIAPGDTIEVRLSSDERLLSVLPK